MQQTSVHAWRQERTKGYETLLSAKGISNGAKTRYKFSSNPVDAGLFGHKAVSSMLVLSPSFS